MRVRIGATTAVLVACVACGPSEGDVSWDASAVDVPEVLALTLFSTIPDERRIFVGSPPASVEAVMPLARDLPVIGGLTREDGGGSVVFESTGTPEEALSDYADLIEDEGWERAPDSYGLRGGFLPSTRRITATWCTDTHWVQANGISFGDRHFLRVAFSETRIDRSPCENARMRVQMERGHYGLHLPDLHPPAGADVQRSGGGGSTNGISMDAVLVVPGMNAERLFEHYASQLDDDDWRRVGNAASNDDVSTARWSAQDESGRPAMGVLAVWRLPRSDTYRAMVRIDRVEGDG